MSECGTDIVQVERDKSRSEMEAQRANRIGRQGGSHSSIGKPYEGYTLHAAGCHKGLPW